MGYPIPTHEHRWFMPRIETREELQLLGQLEAGLVVADGTGSVVVWNEGAERILGIAAEQAVRRPWPQLVTIVRGGVATAREVLAAAALPGGWHGVAECQAASGRNVQVRAHVQRLRDPELATGRGYMAVFWPTGDPGRHLRRTNALVRPLPYQTLFQRSPEPLALATTDGYLIDVNAAATELFGWCREEAIGKHYTTMVPTTNDERAYYRAALTGLGYFSRRMTGTRKDGTTFPMEAIATLISARPGDYVFIRMRDLSDQLRIEKMREEASTRLERELATLSSLAVATGRARSRREVAEAALRRLCEATGAESGMIATGAIDQLSIDSHCGISDETASALVATGAVLRTIHRLERPGIVLTAGTLAAPGDTGLPRQIRDAGIVTAIVAGLRVHDQLIGFMTLGSRDKDWARPSDAVVLQAAAQLASALENARLMERLENGLDHERHLAEELRALQDLTLLGASTDDLRTLASRTIASVVAATRAAGGAYLVASHDTGALEAIATTGRPLDGEADHLRADGALRVSEVGELGPGLARAAILPMRLDDTVLGALELVWSTEPAREELDLHFLEPVARVATISLANFRLRERLVSSELRYRTLFEESPDPMLVSGLDGTVLDANEAAAGMFRTERAQLLGHDCGELTVSDERRIAGRHEELQASGRMTFRDRGRRFDGTEFPFEVDARTVEIGGERRMLSLIRDLSDQERLQRELLQAQKMEALGQLVSGVAHELNNPLAAIIAFSQMLSRDERLPDDMKHDAGLLVQEADRTRRIVQNLLDFARQRPPERRPTRIATLVRSVLDLQSYALNANRIEVAIEIPDDLPEVDLDRAQMQQVLLNLTINAIQAIKAARKGGPSHLSIRAALAPAPVGAPGAEPLESDDGEAVDTAPRVRIAIEDDGPGVPPEIRGRLFDPFFTTKQPGEGTGLGLSVSFGIVAAHDGRLWYEPGPGGVGCSFCLELPVAARSHDERALIDVLEEVVAAAPEAGARAPVPEKSAEAAPSPVASAPAAVAASSVATPTTAPRVLVLDDEPSIRAFLARALTVAGMQVEAFGEGASALDHIRQKPIDVMLVDHRMAGMSGTEFYEAALTLRPDLAARAILMSGDVLNSDLTTFASRHGIRLLAKPFDIDAVRRVVREALAGGPKPSA